MYMRRLSDELFVNAVSKPVRRSWGAMQKLKLKR